MQRLLNMCACHARVSVHCVCILYTLLCVFSSCEKIVIPNENEIGGQPSGNLKVSVFQLEKTSFATLTRAASPVSDVCTRLNFAVYTLDGTRVKLVNQTSAEADFGKASFQLAEGDYLLVVVGHSSNGNPTMTDPTCIKFTNAQGYTDTYICSANITIGEDPVDYQVSLARITALCRFVLTDDEIPSDVRTLQFYYTGGSGAFDATTGFGSVNSKQKVTFDVIASQKQFDLYTYLHDTEGTIHLAVSALDATDNVLYERSFDVPMQQNYITWLSGAFFNDSGSSSITITGVTVNTDWAGEAHLTF